MIDLSGQVALVTGGSRGIGAATAKLLAKAGAQVVITFTRDQKAAIKVVEELQTLNGKAFAMKCNIQYASDCNKTILCAMKKMGSIDILVNSAGIWEYGQVGKMSVEEWERTININLTGTFNMCNGVIPLMKKQRFGKIINIASTAGQRGEAFHSHYAASKGGIIAFTKSLAVEVIRHRIWVNCVAPGWVKTEMVSHIFNRSMKKKEIFRSIPRGAIATPEEIAGPVVFLASHLANHIVGEILNVNGGSVLCG